jgi:hypothetical protein
MKRIELTGAPGAGKTTLYNRICSTSINSRSYLTQKEAWKMAALQSSVPMSQFRLFLYHKILKSGLVQKKEYGLAKRILNEKNRKNEFIKRSDYMKYRISFRVLSKNLSEEDNPVVVLFKLQYFIKQVEEYQIFNRLLNGAQKILVDEGLIHRISGLSHEIFNDYSSDEIKNDEALNPAGVIFCEQSADVIYRHIMERRNRGEKRFSTDHLHDDDLMQFIDKRILSIRSKIKFCETNKIPFLKINPAGDPVNNLKLINSFINEV